VHLYPDWVSAGIQSFDWFTSLKSKCLAGINKCTKLVVAFDPRALQRTVARLCGAKLPCCELNVESAVVKLKLPIVAPEKNPDPIWTGLKLVDSTLVTEAMGRVVVFVRVEIVAWLLLELLSAGHSPFMFVRDRFVGFETFQTSMAT